jgi:hypothetical protein
MCLYIPLAVLSRQDGGGPDFFGKQHCDPASGTKKPYSNSIREIWASSAGLETPLHCYNLDCKYTSGDMGKRTPLGGTRWSVVPLICNLPRFD